MIKLLLFIPLIFSNQNIISEPAILNKNVITEKQITFSELTLKEKDEFIAHVIETGNCEWKGIKLFGKVQFVTSFPDIKVQFVKSFPDIKVEFVSSFPNKCGKWQEVTSFPDFKIQVVTSFPDLKVQKVTSFPGVN
tara:strand:+ start:112 stop:519 length:408 start_codon:yes stop_codon:yes gene_type:complete